MKKILLFSPLIVLATLTLFIAVNGRTDEEIINQSKKILSEIKEIIPQTKRIIIARIDTKDKEKDKNYVYSYQNKRYIIIKEVTDKEEVEKIKNQILEFKIPDNEEDISLRDEASPFLLILLDKDENKIAETNLNTIATSKKKQAEVRNDELSKDIYKYHDEYMESQNKSE